MKGANRYSMHQRSFWQRQAGNPNLFLWTRVYATAYGAHRMNGHAPFGDGELALTLATVNETTGELEVPESWAISRAIRLCVRYGFLESRSTSSCLVVPKEISGGLLGSPQEVCDRRHREPSRIGDESQRSA